MTGRVAVIGDVGGFADQLAGCLRQLGVRTESWPADLHVVQLGDLFGGRDDVEVADLVEPHLVAGRWTQLVGNWELGAVAPFEIGSRGRTADPAALDRFATWVGEGLVHYAAGVRSRAGTWAVVTHAGVTSWWWDVNAPDAETGPELVGRINRIDEIALHLGGEMCPMGIADDFDPAPPSPLWASCEELWASWMQRRIPVAQVHGHSGAYSWRDRRWWPSAAEYAAHASADERHRRVRFDPPGGDHPLWNIDPTLYTNARHVLLHALMVDDGTVVV